MIDSVGYSVENDFDIETSILSAAKKHFENENYEGALKLYLDLSKTGVSAKIYFDIGLCYYKLKNYNNAIEYLKKSTQLDINNANAFSYLGNCYFKKLDANNAIENWIMSRSIKPNDEFVCLNLAIAYFAKNMTFEATYYYDKYLKYSTNKNSSQYKSIYNNLLKNKDEAEFYFLQAEQNRTVQAGSMAETNYKLAIKKYPIDCRYSLGLANLYYDTQSLHKAIPYYNLALKNMKLNKKEVYLKLAECYKNENDYKMAYCYYKRFLQFSTSSQKEYLNIVQKISNIKKQLDLSVSKISLKLAKQYEKNNEYHKALIEYENIVLIFPELSEEYKEIISKLKAFTNSEDTISKRYFKKGTELLQEGKNQNANKYFTEVLNMSNPNSNMYKLAKSKITNV